MKFRKAGMLRWPFLIMIAALLLVQGCQEDGNTLTGYSLMETGTDADIKRTSSSTSSGTTTAGYPQTGMMRLRFSSSWNQYMGGQILMSNGSKFRVFNGALTPPDSLFGQDVVVTMTVESDPVANELIFTFGPSGCQFDAPAEVWLKWSDLGPTMPNLYYIDANGNYVSQQPDQVDLQQQWIMIRVSHFSRYALSHG